MWGGVVIFVAFAPNWCFSREAVYIVANQPIPIKNKPKKSLYQALWCKQFHLKCGLTRMYHHTATEGLYRLRGVKISWTLTLAWVPYKSGFVHFSICLQYKISESSVFYIFLSHEVLYHKVRKVTHRSFWK